MLLTINIEVTGTYTEEELKQYLLFLMGFGGGVGDNPFLDEDSDAEVTDVEFL